EAPQALAQRRRCHCWRFIALQTVIGSGAVRIGNHRQNRFGYRAEATRTDDIQLAIALELLTGLRIVDRNLISVSIHEVAEVALLHGSRGHCSDRRKSLVLLEPITAEEKEGAVVAIVEMGQDYRPAKGESIVVFVVDRRNGLALRVEVRWEETVGVEHAVAVDLEGVTVQTIRSRCHAVGDNSLCQAVLGGEGRALDAKLVHHLKGRIHVGLLPLHVRLHQRNAVEVYTAFKVDAAADFLGPGTALHAGSQKNKLVDLAGVAAQ